MAIEYAPLFALETQFQSKDGRNNTGGWLKVFLAATDDPATTYSDYNGTRNPERIVLDDDGRAVVICDKSKAYRLEVYGIDGALLWTEEPVYCSGTGGGGVSITKVVSTDGSISVDANVAGSTTTYDLSLGIDTDELKPSCLKASSNPLTADGQFVFVEIAHEGGLLSVDNGGKVRMEPAWYHFTATVELAYDGTPVNEGRRVTLWSPLSSSVTDFDTSYAHSESIELSGDIRVDVANTEFPLGVSGIGDGIRASLVGFDIHAVTGHGGNNDYHAGDGITIVNATRTISADFGSVQEKLVAGNNISISGNVISAGNISQEQADWTEEDTESPAFIKNKPDLDVFATKTEVNAGLAGKQDTISDLSAIRSGAQLGSTAVQPADLDAYATDAELTAGLSTKQDVINDLSEIRSGAAAGATAVQPADLAAVATSGSYDDLVNKPSIPTRTSDLTNNSGFITSADVPVKGVEVDGASVVNAQGVAEITMPDLSGYATTQALDTGLAAKQDVISDLSTIRSGAALGSTSVQPGDLATVATTGDYNSLNNRPNMQQYATKTEVNTGLAGKQDVISDLSAIRAGAQLGATAVQPADLDTYATDAELTAGLSTKQDVIDDLSEIRSGAAAGSTALQPSDVATVATTGDYDDLSHRPSIPTKTSDLTNDSGFITLSDVPAQQNADWNSSSGASEILNKPTIPGGTQLVPAATSSDADKVLTVDAQGTPAWAESQGLFIAQYGVTTYSQVVSAIEANKIVYCRISADWNDSRMAFLAYDAHIGANSNVEFQYVRSNSALSGYDSIFAYKVSSSGWTVTERKVKAGNISYPVTRVNVNGASAMTGTVANITIPDAPTVDQTYDASSANAQSGTAVAQAIASIPSSSYTAGNGIDITNNIVSVDTSVVATQTDLADKQDTISDLSTIRSGAAEGATAVQPGDLATVATSGSYNDLSDQPTIPTVDQSYSSSSTNAQSGTAVAQAISGVDEVPEVTSSDSGKVLVATYSGDTGSYAWASTPPANAIILDSSSTWSDFHTAYAAGRKDIYYKDTSPYFPLDSSTELYLHLTAVRDVDGSSPNLTFALFEGAWQSGGVDYTVRCKFRYSGSPLVSDTTLTADKSYSPSSPHAQSGLAVREAISAVNQVPASTSADEGKVLTVDSNGDPEWGTGLMQVQSDWTQSDSTAVDYIKNKPNLATVATTGAYSDLTGTPTIPAAQVNSDWNSSSGASEILNKPTIPSGTQLVPAATSADVDKVLTVNAQGTPAWASAQAPISAGNGIDITDNVVSAKVDGTTIDTNASGELTVIGGGSGDGADWTAEQGEPGYIENKPVPKTLTAGTGISITENASTITVASTVTAKVRDVTVDGTSVVSNGVAAITTPTVDQTYDATSANAQSGVAVATGIAAAIASAVIPISVVATLPANPDPNTLYVVTGA